ncbi:membrane protein insertase YidC [Celeribacter halophilus]|uniref:Membrane protein insertase YidC n=1 Tax=Celeribacter halophilus TaxID=576117 RepID=A0A1I3RRV4_9RHOB|nr:membrane protein insertase YidC [Celeribacter halophilus]PZX06751.1 YidC/Oxa1 family membrane protein insertase [Celeribacter halophilus]SFJ49283.1 YidC/Oxa1 family membrane protein insertase [Celeribacter halophilus]
MDDQNKNLILAVVLSGIVLLGWTIFFPAPEPVTDPNASVATETAATQNTNTTTAIAPPAATGQSDATGSELQTATQAADAPRLTIETPRVEGSISLIGGRIDDLALKDYKVEIDGDEIVTLLEPVGAEAPYYATYGWAPGGSLTIDDVPGANTLWSVEDGATLSPDTPVTLTWDNGKGLVFHRKIEIDENYLFTVTQSVENNTDAAARLFSYGVVARHGTPEVSKYFVLHEGLVRLSDKELDEEKYKNIADFDFDPREGGRTSTISVESNGWTGFTDKNWMTTLIPTPGQSFTSVAKFVETANIYQVETRMPTVDVAPGTSAESTSYLFAGAKEWETIKHYEEDKGFYRFVDSIDWGWFWYFTKPIFRILHALNGLIGNMGWSIVLLTLIIKGVMFPLAYKSYVSMARMKELQPEMEKLKEAAGDDKEKLQRGMMELYKTNKVNPASGCLPLLLQIPVFFSLYKVIFVTIELRHAPWIGWIRDLSAPDPSSILNLFGLLPYAPPEPGSMLAFLSLGILPILLGISMWLQQKLNPAPTDASQAMIMAWMPWVFMFMLGNFASGLVLYWICNNTITFTQQYLIMRSHGHKPDVFGNILRSLRLKKKDA